MRSTVLLAAVLISACGGGPTGPEQPGFYSTGLRILGDPVVTMVRGETVALRIQTRAPGDEYADQPGSAYTWSSSAPDVVEAGTGGVLRARASYGQATITARAANGQTATALVWVQLPQQTPSTYRITLQIADDVPAHWRAALTTAARRWQRVIRASLPPAAIHPSSACPVVDAESDLRPPSGIETGTHVIVEIRHGFSGVPAAVAEPCLQRPLPRPTSIYGRITIFGDIPVADPDLVALHEMGHTLGLVGIVFGGLPSVVNAQTRTYVGPLGLAGYRRAFGKTAFGLPTDGAHWLFPDPDTMSTADPVISQATVGALMDLGYPAAWYGADR